MNAKVTTLSNGHFDAIEVETTNHWLDISHLFVIQDFLPNKVVIIDSLFGYIDVVDENFIRVKSCLKYTNIANRYSDVNSQKGLDDIQRHYNRQFENAKKKAVIFSICPTLSCNLACSYCFEKNYRKDCFDMTLDKLRYIEEHVLKEVKAIREQYPDTFINLELFGGEPIQKRNKHLILEFLQFAKTAACGVNIISNGYELYDFALELIQYRNIIGQICVTLDGTKEYHDKMRITRKDTGSFDNIVAAIDLYLKLGMKVSVTTNLCKDNINSLESLFIFYQEKGWLDSEFFTVYIGRVFSRTTPDVPENILFEGQIIEKIYQLFPKGSPSWLHLAFIKTSSKIAKEIGLLYNQDEYGKADYHYCWTTSPILSGYYVDGSLNTYRCTTTVGNPKYSIGKLDCVTHDSYLKTEAFSKNIFSDSQCLHCQIGGFCGGGCIIEKEYRKKIACNYEKDSFNDFIERVFKPRFMMLYTTSGTVK